MKTISNQKGFTLVEIIAVLVILGILAAVAVPKFIDLQNDARLKAAESAVSETKARLSGAYGKYLLKNGVEPGHVRDLCGSKGLNDRKILPTNGTGYVEMGNDFKVYMTSSSTKATIEVREVQGEKLSPYVKDEWDKP